MNDTNIKIGCEIFLLKDDSILMGKRKNCYGQGTWALPGGHLELGETIHECVKRELMEEIGIKAIKFTLISVIDCIDERGHYIHISFLLEKFLGEIQNMEPQFCYEWNFFELANLPEELFYPHKNIINNFLENVLYLERK